MIRLTKQASFAATIYSPSTLGDVAKALGVIAIPATLLFFIGTQIWADKNGLSATAAVHISLVLELVMVGSVWVFCLRKYDQPWGILGLVAPRLNRLPLALLVIMISVTLTVMYSYIVDLLGYEWLKPEPLISGASRSTAYSLYLFVSLVIVAPFAEEIFFRGFMLPVLANKWGVISGAIISSLIFAFAHGAPGIIVPAFLSGLLFAWLYHSTGSLWNACIAHGGQNALAFTAMT
jgi:membrane protease YdiL (CAAX protease family)